MRDEYRRVMEAERLARQRAQEKAEKEAKVSIGILGILIIVTFFSQI